MHYVVVTEMKESGNSASCTIQGLPENEWESLIQELTTANIAYAKQGDSIDVDCSGKDILSRLSARKYKIVGDNETTGDTSIGPVDKNEWTLCKF